VSSTLSAGAGAIAGGPIVGKAGKYLTFAMGAEKYGVEILKIREIVGSMPITPVPRVPGHYRGVLNLRGQVIPVVDLRAKFSMPPTERPDQACIVITEIRPQGRRVNVGVIVDRVLEVMNIGADQIEAAPSFGVEVSTDFISGIAKMGDGIILLLEIEKVLATDAVLTLPAAAELTTSTSR